MRFLDAVEAQHFLAQDNNQRNLPRVCQKYSVSLLLAIWRDVMWAKRCSYVLALSLLALATSTTFAVQGRGNGNGNGHGKHDRDDDDDEGKGKDKGRGHGHQGYSDHDRDQARRWYYDHQSNLPPGLAKRDRLPPGLERQLVVRGTLPPGLQKKMVRVPDDLERTLPPPPPDCRHVFIGGSLVLVNVKTFGVVDVFHFEVR
jgi:Ni/Co efflux regulator RcnB